MAQTEQVQFVLLAVLAGAGHTDSAAGNQQPVEGHFRVLTSRDDKIVVQNKNRTPFVSRAQFDMPARGQLNGRGFEKISVVLDFYDSAGGREFVDGVLNGRLIRGHLDK